MQSQAPPPRKVRKIVRAHQQREGAGFIVSRPIGGRETEPEETDPFLMLDELGPKEYLPRQFPGAPWHPHRGFDTVMYMKRGVGEHEDSLGNKGKLYEGDVQWMTAGAGILHNEATNHPGGWQHGFQMWVNLPAANKMDPPSWRDISADKIPEYTSPDGQVTTKIIAGEVGGVKAIVQPKAKVQYIDFMCKPGATFAHDIPVEMDNCMVYVYQGGGKFGPDQRAVTAPSGSLHGGVTVPGTPREMAFFDGSGALTFTANDHPDGLHFLLLAGKKLNEPIAWHGPFVMNTQQEIQQALADHQSGALTATKAKVYIDDEL